MGQSQVTLGQLLDGLADIDYQTPGLSGASMDLQSIEITGVTTDPNLCRPGFLYVAAESETVDSTRYGVRLDGRDYISQAAANGAAAVLTDPSVSQADSVILLKHPMPLSYLGTLACRFYGLPRPAQVALVTGTNGKTSTVNFCRMLWSQAQLPSCSVGNLGGVCSDGSLVWDRDPTLSVPETVFLHGMLHGIAGRGFDHVAMEATSHALFDYRLHGLPATIGAFTNLTRDHLDFHETMEEYFRVKMILFCEVLKPGSWAVLNADAEWYSKALPVCRERGHKIISFGHAGNEIKLLERIDEAGGQRLVMEIYGKKYDCHIKLSGYFQASNALCALGIVIASGLSPEKAVECLSALSVVEGRMETVAETPAGGRVLVDYAHTPDGIKCALEACREITTGKLYVIFGCNGERDLGKRPEMGAIASKLADNVIVTDGHPRSEDPANIRRDVLAGAPGAREIAGRSEAIEAVVKELKSGDTLLIAGLGHENFRSIGDQRVPYSDRETAQQAVARIVIAVEAS